MLNRLFYLNSLDWSISNKLGVWLVIIIIIIIIIIIALFYRNSCI